MDKLLKDAEESVKKDIRDEQLAALKKAYRQVLTKKQELSEVEGAYKKLQKAIKQGKWNVKDREESDYMSFNYTMTDANGTSVIT